MGFFKLGLSVLDDAQQVAEEDDDGDLADRRHVDRSLLFDFRAKVLRHKGDPISGSVVVWKFRKPCTREAESEGEKEITLPSRWRN